MIFYFLCFLQIGSFRKLVIFLFAWHLVSLFFPQWYLVHLGDDISFAFRFAQLLERIGPATEKLIGRGIDFSLWFKPENYETDV